MAKVIRANIGVEKLRGSGMWGFTFWHFPLKLLVTLTTVLRCQASFVGDS